MAGKEDWAGGIGPEQKKVEEKGQNCSPAYHHNRQESTAFLLAWLGHRRGLGRLVLILQHLLRHRGGGAQTFGNGLFVLFGIGKIGLVVGEYIVQLLRRQLARQNVTQFF